ncbi:MAG TPA: nickel pincer cofactor biosynthesis protein LarB [Candidatus Sumerlaeota bacterium]|nr:MAG: AIR carboxylase [candidate division BRC1 bacterium ADurb.BinA292]HOE96280.1 nickel pincer cofactor biosynthesis protein LarB [Candidatus Sumerlaeota bacterium]HOR27524.1 nickel pincer cofactor biosynthesis protein LarB [Candidatus Sumerlaeota bacterium]HPK02269.1 nickel pincer cofactor biosynthesis protein LarB [Candidatus Sumerlaeota bacterium]
MNSDLLTQLLQQVCDRRIEIAEAVRRIKALPFEDLEFAKVDLHRALRHGRPEVIYCPGKTPDQVIQILRTLRRNGQHVLATRADPDLQAIVQAAVPEMRYHAPARILTDLDLDDAEQGIGSVLVVAAGTSDLPVAEEAVLTARACGARVTPVYDVGVAGLHRLLAQLDRIQQARAIVVVAGMEGALPSVVGGLCAAPVIAVPTSVGYGASFGGLAALLGMLNSCASNVTVVNIDNGFGAGYVASLINQLPPPDPAPARRGDGVA